MEEVLNVEGAGAAAGATENATPDVSQQQTSSIDGIAEQLLPLLTGKLSTQIEDLMKPYLSQMEGLKRVQGDIDRSRNEFKERLSELNKLTKAGMSQEEAIEHLDRQKAESERWAKFEQQLADLKSLIAGNSQGQATTVASVFQEYGLDPKDPKVAPLLTKQYANKQEMEVAALKAFHQIQTSNQPNAAQGAALTGGAGNRSKTKDISTVTDPSKLYDLAWDDMGK